MLLLTILSLVSVPSAEAIPTGTQLNYRGRFVAEKGDAAATEKQFELTFFVAKKEDGAASAYWTSEERGRGGWSWPDRFGKWELSDKLRPIGGVGPALFVRAPRRSQRRRVAAAVPDVCGTVRHRRHVVRRDA